MQPEPMTAMMGCAVTRPDGQMPRGATMTRWPVAPPETNAAVAARLGPGPTRTMLLERGDKTARDQECHASKLHGTLKPTHCLDDDCFARIGCDSLKRGLAAPILRR